MARRRRYGPKLEIVYTGPFFDNDPRQTFRRNLRDFIKDSVEEAANVARSARVIDRTGNYRRSIEARVKSVSGKPWAVTGVVSTRVLAAPFKSSRYGRPYFNYSGKVERRTKAMRRGRSQLFRIRAKNRDLLRGIR